MTERMTMNNVWDILEWEGPEYFLREVRPEHMPDERSEAILRATQAEYAELRRYFNECEDQYDG